MIIGNGRLITRDENNTFIENGAVLIKGKLIKAVGTTEQLRKDYPGEEFIDAYCGVIMPGMINTHNHIYSALARGLSIKGYNPHNFIDILDGLWWTLDRKLTLEETRVSAEATYIDCIKNGVTTIFDHHASFGSIEGSLFEIAEAAKKYGIRSNLCYEVSDRDGKEKSLASIKENADFIKYCQKDDSDMLKAMMGIHASFTVSDETFALCRKEMPDDVGFHVHVAEGIADLHMCLKDHGKRVVERLMDNGVLGSKTIAVHCVHINNAEIEMLKETDTMVVHNPESNMGNAVGCPPTLDIFNAGVLTGLGTDGYTNDMLESYKVANILHKHNKCMPNVAWGEIPAMLFENNAKIANRYFSTPLGMIKEGYSADVVVTDYNPLTPMDGSNCNGHILFGMNGRSVVTTVAAGKLLMKDRELIGIDEAAVMAHAREMAAKLAKDING